MQNAYFALYTIWKCSVFLPPQIIASSIYSNVLASSKIEISTELTLFINVMAKARQRSLIRKKKTDVCRRLVREKSLYLAQPRTNKRESL